MTPFVLFTSCIGYFFCNRVWLLKYKVVRKENWHIFFYSFFFGAFFQLVAYSISNIICRSWFCITTSELNYLIFLSVFALCLSYITSLIVNHVIGIRRSLEFSFGDDLSELLLNSIQKYKYPQPVQFTLDNRKSYVGFVLDSLEPKDDGSFITILPLFSGHRDKDTLCLSLDYDYSTFFNDDDSIEKLPIVIPKHRIMNCNIFNHEMYREFNTSKSD